MSPHAKMKFVLAPELHDSSLVGDPKRGLIEGEILQVSADKALDHQALRPETHPLARWTARRQGEAESFQGVKAPL